MKKIKSKSHDAYAPCLVLECLLAQRPMQVVSFSETSLLCVIHGIKAGLDGKSTFRTRLWTYGHPGPVRRRESSSPPFAAMF